MALTFIPGPVARARHTDEALCPIYVGSLRSDPALRELLGQLLREQLVPLRGEVRVALAIAANGSKKSCFLSTISRHKAQKTRAKVEEIGPERGDGDRRRGLPRRQRRTRDEQEPRESRRLCGNPRARRLDRWHP